MKLKMEDVLSTPFVSSLGFFNDKELSNLLRTSKKIKAAGKIELNAQRGLLKHVVLGKQNEAEALIKTHPKWLLSKSHAQDYSGRTIIATPFQAAISAGDKLMWEMILRYLDPDKALRQFREWFPNGIEDETPASAFKDYYNQLAQAMTNQGKSVIEPFREMITQQKEIRQGKYFNLQHLIAASQAYIDNFNTLRTLTNRDLFWNQVIGYVQRQMTAYDAQVHCSGLEDPNAFLRSFTFTNGKEFFPVSINSGLGFDFGIYSDHVICKSVHTGHPPLISSHLALKSYVEQKQMHLQDLESHLSTEYSINPGNS